MDILFCHDGPINCDELNRYYSFGFNDKLFDRYASIFEKISIATRVNKDVSSSKYTEQTRLNTEKYPVLEYPNFLSLHGIFENKRESTERLKQAISRSDALIIRLPSFLGSKCVKLARKYKKPYLIEVVGCPWDSLRNHGFSGKLLAPYLYFLTKKQVKKATDVLYVTDEFLQKRYPTKARTIGCSDVLLDSVDTGIELKPLKTKHEKLIIGTAGVLDVRYKGQEFVIDVVSELTKMGIDAEYRLAGSGTGEFLRNKAISLGVENKVKFLGLLDRTALDAFYDSLDIYIQPSLTEGMPRALIEAMSRGCYCIGTNVGGIPELVGKEYCFGKGNTEQILRQILQYYEDKDNANRTRCVNRSKDFSAPVLERKRTMFYQTFKNNVDLRRDEEHL